MKITLLNVLSEREECINKDTMGGYGSATKIGNSFLAKLIEYRKKSGVKLPVFVLGYIAAIFSNKGHIVEYKINEIPKDSDLIIMPSSIVDHKIELEYAKKIKEETKAKVGFIGPFASVKSELFLKHADFVIKNEPEQAMIEIAEGKIPTGLVESQPIKDLDILPYPKWDIFPIESYGYSPMIDKKPFIPILSSRGCVFGCNYCPYKAYYGAWRQRTPENIIKEIKYLKEKYNIKGLLFRDPLFTFDKERSKKIAELIIQENLDIEWACETHFDYLDEELIDKLYESGFRSLNVGIESSDPEILKNATRKSATIEKQNKIVDYCHKKGIRVAAFYIFGLPDDTKESIQNTINYAKKLNTIVAQFFISTPFPGTSFHEQIKDKIYDNDFSHYTSYMPVFRHKNLTKDELLNLKEKAFISYYFRPRYAFKFLKEKIK